MVLRRYLPLFAAAFLLVFTACGGDEGAAAAQDRGRGDGAGAPKRVRTDRVVERQLGTSVVVSGTLAAFDRATAGTKVAGRVQTLAVDLGSRVGRAAARHPAASPAGPRAGP